MTNYKYLVYKCQERGRSTKWLASWLSEHGWSKADVDVIGDEILGKLNELFPDKRKRKRRVK